MLSVYHGTRLHKNEKKSMHLYDFRVYPIYILIIATIGR